MVQKVDPIIMRRINTILSKMSRRYLWLAGVTSKVVKNNPKTLSLTWLTLSSCFFQSKFVTNTLGTYSTFLIESRNFSILFFFPQTRNLINKFTLKISRPVLKKCVRKKKYIWNSEGNIKFTENANTEYEFLRF
jgi:hypothetical protein